MLRPIVGFEVCIRRALTEIRLAIGNGVLGAGFRASVLDSLRILTASPSLGGEIQLWRRVDEYRQWHSRIR